MTTTFGFRLQTALDLSLRDRQELADALRISVQAVGQVLAGKTRALTAENTARAARFLGVDWYWLATGDGTPAPHGQHAQVSPDESWPFARLPLSRVQQLTENQRLALEDTMIKVVDAHLGTDTPNGDGKKSEAA